MIPKFIRLGVETILKIICEKIIIKDIKIVNKDDKFSGIIDELYIKAESIIFNKINISNINIKIKDVVLKFAYNKIFSIDNCDAEIYMRLSIDNINKTLLNNKWKILKTKIESFILNSFQSIEFNNKSIHFITSDGISIKNNSYTLQNDKNNIFLLNNINKESISILDDKNIIIRNLFFFENYIEIELTSKIIFT